MIGDPWRSRARTLLLGPRALLLGGVAVAVAAGFFLTSALTGGAAAGGVIIQAKPHLVSYQSGGDPNVSTDAAVDVSFTIAGNASQVLYPGTRSTIDLAFTNQSSQQITLPASAIAITLRSAVPGCPASPNFAVVQTLTSAITIPKGATGDSLADMGIPTTSWPVISMVTTHVSQDACEGMTLRLHYSASVASTGPVTGSTTGSGSGSQSGGASSSGSTVPVTTATAAASSGLAFTGFDVLLLVGSGGLLIFLGIGFLTWRRRLGARR